MTYYVLRANPPLHRGPYPSARRAFRILDQIERAEHPHGPIDGRGLHWDWKKHESIGGLTVVDGDGVLCSRYLSRARKEALMSIGERIRDAEKATANRGIVGINKGDVNA